MTGCFKIGFCFFFIGLAGGFSAAPAATDTPDQEALTLKVWGIPDETENNINTLAIRQILRAFHDRYPSIKLQSPAGLEIPGKTMDILPLLQIAGDIPPDVMFVNFRQSDTFIHNKFLYPLDQYIEQAVGTRIPQGHLLSLEEYLVQLKKAPRYARELEDRIPRQCWPVMRRKCPYGENCPYLRDERVPPATDHYHVWCFPEGPTFIALFYRRDLFADAGLPDRVPETWDEFLAWARVLTNPRKDQYGLALARGDISWATSSFLYSMGGKIVDQDTQGNWKCVFDGNEAVEAYYFVTRLFLEPYQNLYGTFNSVVSTDEAGSGQLQPAMFFNYMDQRFFMRFDPNQYGFGPVPRGPTGRRGSEFNCAMVGIYADLARDEKKREAAWKYISFYNGPESRKIYARAFVENGYGQFVQPALLREAGYEEYIHQIPPQWEKAARVALESGVPEPYGKNCQMVYSYVDKALNQICTDPEVARAIRTGDAPRAKDRIRRILHTRVTTANERMLSVLTPRQRSFRTMVASISGIIIFALFVLVFRRVFRIFTPPEFHHRGAWQFSRYKWAYLLMLPALGTIALWAYWPLVRGTVMAFQDYNVRGFSQFVGMDNFAAVLFDDEFWYSLWVSLKYAILYMIFGFGAPIALALLLTEVPRGKLLFRTLYYLPAVLTGVVVIFLWKGFYGQYGMINQVLNFFILLLNHVPGVNLSPVDAQWLDRPRFALFFCLLPTIWAGMGPGSLIYLAALKTIPEDLYEAADIDGAGIWDKTFQVAIPSIKALILINFIGAIIGAVKSGSEFILAMTGGGPYNPYGQTEVVGLHIFWEAFGYLRFGTATAMAWVLGSMLIGFTVLQLQRISRMEFKTAGGT